jgi:UPF0755 protein
MARTIRRVIAWILIAGVVACVAVAGVLYQFAHTPLEVNVPPAKGFELKVGSSLRSIARQLVDAGILTEPWRFELITRLSGNAVSLKAGSYEVATPITPLELIDKLTRGDVVQEQITFVEGWTLRQWRQALGDHPNLRHDTQTLSDPELLERVGATGYPSGEGLFFPDTYRFNRGASDLDVLRQAREAMQRQLESFWSRRAANLPFESPYQALILASIVEKETGVDGDRPMVAAVFVNRLRRGMKLQTDPTVIYGLGMAFDGNLRKVDLLRDTPFNTYTRGGLPPTPIAMPGVASLSATLNPPQSDALYFVARGDGTSHFSATLEEHNRAVNRYQRARR